MLYYFILHEILIDPKDAQHVTTIEYEHDNQKDSVEYKVSNNHERTDRTGLVFELGRIRRKSITANKHQLTLLHRLRNPILT